MHGVINTAFDGVQQQFGTFPGGINKHFLLFADVEDRIDKDARYEQGNGGCYYACREATKHAW